MRRTSLIRQCLIVLISPMVLATCAREHSNGNGEDSDSANDSSTDSESESGGNTDTSTESDSAGDSDTEEETESDSAVDSDTEEDTESESIIDSETEEDTESDSAVDSETGEDMDSSSDSYVPQSCEGTVLFPDPALETAVRKSINRYVLGQQYNSVYAGELTGDILSDLDTLGFAQGEGISSLDGIECLTNVETLLLADNEIADISLLSGLTKVLNIGLEKNLITDLEPLRKLTQLETIVLSDNPIASMEPLSALTHIREISFDNTGTSSLEWISKLTEISFLRAFGNGITDISSLSSLGGLKTFDLSDNEIVDLSPLSGLSDCVNVYLSDNHIVDLTPLDGITFLGLHLSNNAIVDITPLAHASKDDPNNALGELWLDGNQIADISVLAELPSVYPTLFDNRIKDLTPLLSMDFIQSQDSFDFSKNQIEDLTPIASFGNLGYLDISDNLVFDLSPLSGKPLGVFKAARNAIHDLTPLVSIMGRVQELDLTDNRVVSITPIWAGMLSFESAPTWISLLGNPLDEASLSIDIPNICALNSTEVYFGDGETCSWNTDPTVVITAFDETPPPYDGVDEIEETCDASPIWLTPGALPSTAHNGSDFEIDDTNAAEPIVNDLITGLTWQRCSVGQTFDGEVCQGSAASLTMTEMSSACQGTFGGFDDWRPASISELISLIDFSVAYPGPTIDSDAFPGTYPGGYWSSTAVPKTSEVIGRQVNFYNGTSDIAGSSDAASVRCVRGGADSPAALRFGPGEETVVDTWTGLEWRRCAEGQTVDGEQCDGLGTARSWDEAESACAVSFAGMDDWRLPTIVELQSIVNRCHVDPASFSAFSNTPPMPFWSDTSFPGADPKYWRQDFGFDRTEPAGTADTAFVRCVR